MKDQYFGDVNDYRKYGLLRALIRVSGLRLGVWWMRTVNDERTDGRFTEYLSSPDRWSTFDPALFESLRALVPTGRRVSHVREAHLLPGAWFAEKLVPDATTQRLQHFANLRASLASVDLVFADPDNGIQVPSRPPGRRDSNKYLLWREIEELYGDQKSLVIYQHFPRRRREEFVEQKLNDLQARTGASGALCVRTPNVAFFVVPQPTHKVALTSAVEEAGAAWPNQLLLANTDV